MKYIFVILLAIFTTYKTSAQFNKMVEPGDPIQFPTFDFSILQYHQLNNSNSTNNNKTMYTVPDGLYNQVYHYNLIHSYLLEYKEKVINQLIQIARYYNNNLNLLKQDDLANKLILRLQTLFASFSACRNVIIEEKKNYLNAIKNMQKNNTSRVYVKDYSNLKIYIGKDRALHKENDNSNSNTHYLTYYEYYNYLRDNLSVHYRDSDGMVIADRGIWYLP